MSYKLDSTMCFWYAGSGGRTKVEFGCSGQQGPPPEVGMCQIIDPIDSRNWQVDLESIGDEYMKAWVANLDPVSWDVEWLRGWNNGQGRWNNGCRR